MSSDILKTLMYGLSPAERGLVNTDDQPIAAFPPDYTEHLIAALEKANPELFKGNPRKSGE